ITSSGWPFVSAVLGQMAHLVASITLNSARSYVIQSAFLTQRTVSSIPIIFSWSDSIRPERFPVFCSVVSNGKIRLPSSGPQFGDSTFYQKLIEFNPGASLSPVFLLVLSAFAIVAACASRATGYTAQ
ncbi:hypothetical protein Tco_0546168, partial [Tanacetum coccineum]